VTDVAINVENLGKQYIIGHELRRERYTALRDVIARGARTFLRKANDVLHGRAVVEGDELEEVWALRGRNGAGKSTLLRVLSRITEPTTGRVLIRGRLASLLEVGTGFHPELTGRENIYLNGAILGMSRSEIARKFDQIVAFADVERYLDTPVKRYSSGMYVRLAFAVAAHLEPEILVVDEVLAVGDAEFQKKCIGTMRDAARREGRTVLFVSHNLSAVRSLCRSSIVLSDGALKFAGSVEEGLGVYANLQLHPQARREVDTTRPRITDVRVDGEQTSAGHFEVRVDFTSPWPLDPPLVGLVIYNQLRSPIFGFNTWQDRSYRAEAVRSGTAILRIPNLPLHSGVYTVGAWLGEKQENYDAIEDAATFTFISPEPLPAGLSAETVGATRVSGRWELLKGE